VKWLLDTNVVSEGVRGKPNVKVMSWIATESSRETAISIVTLAELRDGASSVRDEAKRRQFAAWIDAEIMGSFGDRTIPLTTEVLLDWVRLSRRLRETRNTRDPADLLIASTARVHNLTLVSRNVRDFAGTGIVVYDPWTSETHRMEQA
jgi:predicted nucleic acid-binding protein